MELWRTIAPAGRKVQEFARNLLGSCTSIPPASAGSERRGCQEDIADNSIDEDCTGTDSVNLDRDGDGVLRPADCDDASSRIRLGAVDTPGNRVDEDCSGRDW